MPANQRPPLDTLAVSAIHFYRNTLSRMILPSCRFFPSCSAYASDAVMRYGVISGGSLIVRRLLRCHPLARGGFDPVR